MRTQSQAAPTPNISANSSATKPTDRRSATRSDEEKIKQGERLINAETSNPCVQCGVEETKEKPMLICSRCRKTSCSKACQLTHYPSHRAPCRRNARGREQVEHMVLAHPVFANANMDSEEHLKSILGDAMMAARSALRLGKPDSLAQTHVLILRFNYDSKPVQLRERFKLAEVIVRSFDEHLKLSQPSLHPSIRRIMPSSNTVPRSFWSLPGETDGFYVGLIHETVLLMDNKPVTMSQHQPLVISPRMSYNIYGDYRYLSLNTHWQELLRWSLSRPAAPRSLSILLLEDLYMSEGKTVAEMRMEQTGKKMDRLMHLMALVKAGDGLEGEAARNDKKVEEKEKALHDKSSRSATLDKDCFHPVVRALMSDEPKE